ncbi:longitudinals lacking protein, isoforms H/M/V isoform X4 [Diabrotica virgifera virgifera]|uniref:BTB domain-containing protein n=1 Tax=Diabrotica virgifera virgifera TaxID=50390 RepID=A0ABM5JX59_DIAVI|nr:longitudinals lacking protein, isoforms H/M/V isoform X4 [Diabrotica virgifera virgifera]
MDDDQQFCLRWNNHQSTLVAVFDTLLENGTLVDCTLAAEGKCLNAHKVVLSACSPYFEALLSKHFDKHPILILKDVKFQELKAMMDYMYRGEVNISQDQLGALLKAAESLQIKGLSDNRKGETERKPTPAPPPKSPQPTTLPKVQGLTIEQRAREDSREGSMSPGPRKKKRLRRKSEELDNHDASNSSESHSLPAQSIPTLPAISKMNMNADVPEQIETKSEILTRHKQTDDMPQVPIIKEKIETHTELMLEPKSEYVEEMNEDSIEDLTLDDDDLSNMEQVDDQAGPSHGAGEGSSQGFGGWHMGNQSQDEVFLAAQEAVGAHRDSQVTMSESSEVESTKGKYTIGFVHMLRDFPILLSKSQKPAIRESKSKALEAMRKQWELNFGSKITTNQINKKINNMKFKLKKKTDINTTDNKKIVLLDWEKILLEIMEGDTKPVLTKIPGAWSVGTEQTHPRW